jgi:acetylcholinesterase
MRYKFHGTDTFYIKDASGELSTYLINFVNKLDPNGNGSFNWPKYTKDSPNMLTLQDGDIPLQITQDTYRSAAIDLAINLTFKHPM